MKVSKLIFLKEMSVTTSSNEGLPNAFNRSVESSSHDSLRPWFWTLYWSVASQLPKNHNKFWQIAVSYRAVLQKWPIIQKKTITVPYYNEINSSPRYNMIEDRSFICPDPVNLIDLNCLSTWSIEFGDRLARLCLSWTEINLTCHFRWCSCFVKNLQNKISSD